MRTVSLPIAGMTCNGCAAAATKAIAAVPGVKRVLVSLAAGKADITADERPAALHLVVLDLAQLLDRRPGNLYAGGQGLASGQHADREEEKCGGDIAQEPGFQWCIHG